MGKYNIETKDPYHDDYNKVLNTVRWRKGKKMNLKNENTSRSGRYIKKAK